MDQRGISVRRLGNNRPRNSPGGVKLGVLAYSTDDAGVQICSVDSFCEGL